MAEPLAGELIGLILPGPHALEHVAGVPVAVRAALLLRRAGCARVVVLAGPGSRALAEAIQRHPRSSWVELASELPEGQLVVVGGDVAFHRPLLDTLVERARSAPFVEAARSTSGFVVAGTRSAALPIALAHERSGLAAALEALPPADGAAGGVLLGASTREERRAASTAILRATGKAVDGPLTSLFERRISQAISGVLLPFPISPNAVTTFSLFMGLSGAALLATRGYETRCLGAAIFVASTIVDGCDGEISRSKLLESHFGKLYDSAVDIAVSVAVFVAITIGTWRELEGVPEVRDAALLLVGGALFATVVVETLRRLMPALEPASVMGRAHAWLERFATSEWSYLVLALALLEQLPFFFFGAAVAANVFALTYLALGLSSLRPRTRKGVAETPTR